MNAARVIIRYAALVGATAFLAACPPNAILSGLQDKVNAGQGGGQTVSTPAFAPSSGTYQFDQPVTLSDSTPGATIHYTSATGGGNPPDPTSASPVFSAPIMVSGNGTIMTIKAIATNAGMADSSVAIGAYTINNSQVSTPQFSLASGAYGSAQLLTITDSSGGAQMAYTTDGSVPTESGGSITHGTLYSVPLNVSTTQMIRAIAFKVGLSDSTLVTATYTLPDAVPSFSPPGGNYPNTTSVTLATNMLAATIRYTTDNSTPTPTVGTVYVGPVSVGVTETLKAIAYASGWADSGVSTAAYTITTYTVTYNINGGHGGSVPTDPNAYHQGDTVTVLAPTGNLKKGPKDFDHWNTQSNDGGTSYNVGDTFPMGTTNVTLYAIYP